ncbi:MAG: helix-turn-helix domain-containing protein [Saprospiraceae bacterium]|nr:helix-turn-helix domain-containing protein [Saprospiraceae bacterium]
MRWQILPSGCLELIFNLGEKMDHIQGQKVNDSFNPTENFCFLSGLHTKPLYMEFSNFHVMGVQMAPLAAKSLFGIPCSELKDWAIPGDQLLRHVAEIEDRLCGLPNFKSRAQYLEALIYRHIQEEQGLTEAIKIHQVVGLASKRKQNGSPIQLEDLTGYSRMHTFRLFKDWMGLPPSRTLALCQFTGAIDEMHVHDGQLTQIGLNQGYFDQPHFIRNFKEHARMTPGQYRSRMSFLPGQLPY